MDFFAEIIGLLLLVYPGAIIRWLIFRRKKFDDYVKDDPYKNAFAISITLLSCILIRYILIKMGYIS